MNGSCDSGSHTGPPTATTSDYVSPFASSFAQQQDTGTPRGPPSPPPEPSRSTSPVRVVGFDSSPTSVVALRRWQSAADPGMLAALDAAAAMQAGAGGAAQPAAPKCAMARQSSLGAALKQQEHIAALQKRLSIHTGRSPLAGGAAAKQRAQAQRPHGGAEQRPPAQPAALTAYRSEPLTAATIEEALEQDWMAALTPGSSELEAAAAAHAPVAQQAMQPTAVPAIEAPEMLNPFGAQAAEPFASSSFTDTAVAQALMPAGLLAGRQSPEPAVGTLPADTGAAHGMHSAALGPPLQVAPCGLLRRGSGAAPTAAVARQHSLRHAGSTSIDIPYHRVRRAETAPALTDDLIAAAIAAVYPSSGGSDSSAGANTRPAGPASGGSGGSSQRGSPPVRGGGTPLPPLPERHVCVTRQVFEAQAEAVAAQTQVKVLQQALTQEQDRVEQLQRQLRALLRERAEDKARIQQHEAAHEALLRAHQQQQALAGRRAAAGTPPLPAAGLRTALVASQLARGAGSRRGLERLEKQKSTSAHELAAALAAMGR